MSAASCSSRLHRRRSTRGQRRGDGRQRHGGDGCEHCTTLCCGSLLGTTGAARSSVAVCRCGQVARSRRRRCAAVPRCAPCAPVVQVRIQLLVASVLALQLRSQRGLRLGSGLGHQTSTLSRSRRRAFSSRLGPRFCSSRLGSGKCVLRAVCASSTALRQATGRRVGTQTDRQTGTLRAVGEAFVAGETHRARLARSASTSACHFAVSAARSRATRLAALLRSSTRRCRAVLVACASAADRCAALRASSDTANARLTRCRLLLCESEAVEGED
jgi:hypothetical protein